jgi:integrase
MRKWATVRKQMGIEHPGATLKAFRRGAARQLTVGGMPLDMLRQYLRHESVSTTMGYLRLVGGYDKNEMRKFLK